MKIAVFYNLPFSGAKRTVLEHVKGLKKLNNKVDVYTINLAEDIFDLGKFADNQYSFTYSRKKINLPVARKVAEDISDFYTLRNLHKKIAREIDQNNYDIVLVHTDHYTQAPFLLRYLKTKKMYFCLEPLKMGYEFSFHKNENLTFFNKAYENLNRIVRRNIDRTNARSADKTFAISLFGRELMISSFDLYPKISYLGVDVDIFKSKKVKKKNQVLFIGQKLNINGYNYAVEAINKIPEKIRPTLKVVSIGKNNRLSDAEIVKLYNESVVTLSLSNFDTFGLVPLESMACGTPVIAFNVAGYREIIKNNETGYLVDFNSEEIKDRILEFINDKNLSEKMGKKGIEWVKKNWTWESNIKKLNKDLNEE